MAAVSIEARKISAQVAQRAAKKAKSTKKTKAKSKTTAKKKKSKTSTKVKKKTTKKSKKHSSTVRKTSKKTKRPPLLARSKLPRLGQKIIYDVLQSQSGVAYVPATTTIPLVPNTVHTADLSQIGSAEPSPSFNALFARAAIANATRSMAVPALGRPTAMTSSTKGPRQGQLILGSVTSRLSLSSTPTRGLISTPSASVSSTTQSSSISSSSTVLGALSFSTSSLLLSTHAFPLTDSLSSSSDWTLSMSNSATSPSATSSTAPEAVTSGSKSLAHNTTLLVALITGAVIVAAVVLFGLAWLCRRSRKQGLHKNPAEEENDLFAEPWLPRRPSVHSEASDCKEIEVEMRYSHYDSYLAGAIPQFPPSEGNNSNHLHRSRA